MPTLDFELETIEIRSASDKWGPFEFNMTKGIPPGETLQSAVVRSFDNETGEETTNDLIEPNTTVINGSSVSVALQYPGDTKTGYHYLQFDLTLSNSRKHPYIFGYVKVE